MRTAFMKTIVLVMLFTNSVYCAELNSQFNFKKSKPGVELFENGKPVFYYQKEPKTLTGEYYCNNYLHPLYTLDGDTLTEEFPADHPYHRGIYWAWHQIYKDNQKIGDSWMMENISFDVVKIKTNTDRGKAQLNVKVLWKSSVFQSGKPFMNEQTSITVHELHSNLREIDFEIMLNPLVPGIQIGGSEDEKGYGGFCARIKLPDGLVFTSEKGEVIPQLLVVKRGPWIDFSVPFGKHGELHGITVLCHPSMPNYPESWILRYKDASMQNIVFPSKERIELSMNKPTVLRYRVVIHKGNSAQMDMTKIMSQYGKTYSKNYYWY